MVCPFCNDEKEGEMITNVFGERCHFVCIEARKIELEKEARKFFGTCKEEICKEEIEELKKEKKDREKVVDIDLDRGVESFKNSGVV